MVELSVCIGSSCHLKGSYNVIQTFLSLIEECNLHGRIDFRSAFCMKECHLAGVGLTLNGEAYRVMPDAAAAFFREKVLPLV